MMSLTKLIRRFTGSVAEQNAVTDQEAVRLATAVLLVEIMRADYSEHEAEAQAIERLLAQHFDIDAASSETLVEDACDEADRSVSLHEYTKLLHAELTVQEKAQLIEMLWEVALADEALDKYEDYLVRKVADLLYVAHPELIRLKHKVQQRLLQSDES